MISEVSKFSDLYKGIDRILTDRGYDDYPASDELFDELVSELYDFVTNYMEVRNVY